ncbi:C40 family peptidase [Paenibacillus crassostreae]|uniref:NlpC/P60 domain-containing protein n=1 Tax=Paenibacillus crassostreae TaxID=1763538 RepID=A0A167BBL9_9BACL|nr:C40 family peptidase [Paenibacillus crassostreae]AOZ92987.1 hypothetical protein LPB68_12695 [Paenibacillus crassostreae]OAB71924.1 hypothetical protein PNBC_18195 [Paenibacillus crassostreae]
MRGLRVRTLMVGLMCISMLASACVNNGGQAAQEQNNQKTQKTQNAQNNQNVQKLNVQQSTSEADTINSGSETAAIQIISHNKNSYVPLGELVNVLELNSEWDEGTQTYSIGEIDVVYKMKVNSKNAEKAEEDVLLTREPIMVNDKLLISLEDIQLFQEYMNYDVNDQQLIIYPSYTDANKDINDANHDLDFSDDAEDPAGGNDDFEGNAPDIEGTTPQDNAVWIPYTNNESVTVFTRKNVNANKLIATGRKYMGVKYKFGASKYSKSKRFDCSSYVQQLYRAYGVQLPRTARNQAKVGVSVSRKNLRKGDLLYFYVPGRFKTNKTVGHVGIYIGNNKMLHSSPKPKNGVQITNINKAYWKRTYISAKRVIK